MKKYYEFSKKHFEYELRGICIRNKFKVPVDITEEHKAEGGDTWEYIYKIQTKNPAVSIIIFSSVSIKTSKVRENGADAVRVVLKWETRKGTKYKAVHTHYRIKTLFNNLENTLVKEIATVFNLTPSEFVEAI